MIILDGKVVAAARQEALKKEIENFNQKTGRVPLLVVVLVGSDPASQVYVGNKHKTCQKLGMNSKVVNLPESTSEADVLLCLKGLAADEAVDGILVQLPLPKRISTERVIAAIAPEKDADGLSIGSMGALMRGVANVRPCTPQGILSILDHYRDHSNLSPIGTRAVVVGRSLIVGKPMSLLLLERNYTVTITHSKTENLAQFTREADLVVVAAGIPRFLGKDDFKKDSVVIDVGMHRLAAGLCGDVRYEELAGHVRAATPVPGGVGPMTITTLLENTLQLARLREGLATDEFRNS